MHLFGKRHSRNAPQFDITQARYFKEVQQTLNFTRDELSLLAENGFLVTDRLAFERFKRAYAYIYWKDLPVLVTTDSILHAICLHYSKLLKAVEGDVIVPALADILYQTRADLQQQASANQDSRLVPLYDDLDVYLCVAHTALGPHHYRRGQARLAVPPRAQSLVELVSSTNGMLDYLPLFGVKQWIDFSHFTPRGHYTEESVLEQYFRAMMWLALVNFPLLEFDEWGKPIINRGALAAAHLLRDALDRAGQRQNLAAIDRVLRAFVGWSDNVTLDSLDSLLHHAGVAQPGSWFALDDETLLCLLQTKDYGQQQITGSPLSGSSDPLEAAKRPIVFSLMGQRFNLESWIMGELVYDGLVVEGRKVERAYPNPLDVMAVLGNDRAFTHLGTEFARYGYEDRLVQLLAQVATYSTEFWESTLYNRWLRVICSLNDLSEQRVPSALRSPAWADKLLHTQLASWTQLRHENILLVKQSYGVGICDYPTGYVEPYPDFYATVKDYADFGLRVLESLALDEQDAKDALLEQFAEDDDLIATMMQPYLDDLIHRRVASEAAFFKRLSEVAAQLQTLAQKELDGEPFTEEEQLFVRSVVVRKSITKNPGPYGGYIEETWGGWYADLVGWDQTPALVADVHTNLNKDIGEVGVLHTATGHPVLEALVIECDEGSMIYVGPAFSYYELRMTGQPLHRLNDEEWRARLQQPQQGPDWTQSFRKGANTRQEVLELPRAE